MENFATTIPAMTGTGRTARTVAPAVARSGDAVQEMASRVRAEVALEKARRLYKGNLSPR